MGETPRQRILSRHAALRRARAPWDDRYVELGKYLLPWRTRFQQSERSRLAANDAILDPTGTYAVRTCAAGMSAGFCSAARDWFNYAPPVVLGDSELGKSARVKRYCQDSKDVIRDILSRSNFYGAVSGYVLPDLVAFSMGYALAEQDDKAVLSFRSHAIGSYWLAADANGEVDTSYTEHTYTVGQLAKEFGLAVLPADVREQYTRCQYDTEHRVLHVIEPNRRDEETGFEGQRSNRFDWKGMGFRSIWLLASRDSDTGPQFLRVSGYHEFPGLVSRWGRTAAEDVYATGASFDALPDVKQLQSATRRKLQLIDKVTMPQLQGPASWQGVPSQLPGSYTPIEGAGPGSRVEAIYTPHASAIEQVRQDINELRWSIRQGLFADLWRLITDDDRSQPATAEEIRAKREERLLLLGPVATNFNEFLRKVHDRTFAEADRRGLLPEPPPELAGLELKLEFQSVLTEAQRAQEIPSVERVAGFVQVLMQIDAEAGDAVDADKFADRYADIAGLPPDLMREMAKRVERRQGRAQAAADQAQSEATLAGAQSAKALAGAPIADDNALGALLGTLGPVAAVQAGVGGAG